MATVHASYGLPIFVADDGELPQRGAFFATNNKWTLSKIAKAAYNDSSAWKVINRNGWNTSNLIYRADSTNCSSPRRESSLALTTVSPAVSAKSAFIALCQRDARPVDSIPARSFKFPVIWIPDLDKMPLPVEQKGAPEEPETTPSQPSTTVIDSTQADIDMVVDPGKPSSSDSGGGSGGGSGSGSGSGGGLVKPTTPTPAKAGMSPFVLIGGGLLMLLGVLLWPVSDGSKRKKKR